MHLSKWLAVWHAGNLIPCPGFASCDSFFVWYHVPTALFLFYALLHFHFPIKMSLYIFAYLYWWRRMRAHSNTLLVVPFWCFAFDDVEYRRLITVKVWRFTVRCEFFQSKAVKSKVPGRFLDRLDLRYTFPKMPGRYCWVFVIRA